MIKSRRQIAFKRSVASPTIVKKKKNHSKNSTVIKSKTSTRSATKFKNLSEKDAECLRHKSERRLKAAWANIIKRYQNVSNNETDEIDLRSQTVVIDRGVIQNYDEHKVGTASGKYFSDALMEDADDDTVWQLELDKCVNISPNPVNTNTVNTTPVNTNPNPNPVNTTPVTINSVNTNSVNTNPMNTDHMNTNPVNTNHANTTPVNTQASVQRRLQLYSVPKSPHPVHTTEINSRMRRLQLYSVSEATNVTQKSETIEPSQNSTQKFEFDCMKDCAQYWLEIGPAKKIDFRITHPFTGHITGLSMGYLDSL